MSTEDNTLMRDRIRPKAANPPSLRSLYEQPNGKPVVPELVTPAPELLTADAAIDHIEPWPTERSDYKASGETYVKQALHTIFFLKDWLPSGFSYANLERVFMRNADTPGQGPILVARFAGSVITEVVIEGRHLKPICNSIGRHLCPWLWQIPTGRDFKEADKPCITKITFDEK